MSIVYMALENIVGGSHRAAPLDDRVRVRPGARLRLLVRAARRRCSSPASHLLASLLSFNIGVELGQLLVLLLLIPLLDVLFRFVVAERMGTIILSALVAHTGWHWMIDRADRLRQFRFEWPALTAALPCRRDALADAAGDRRRLDLVRIRSPAAPPNRSPFPG